MRHHRTRRLLPVPAAPPRPLVLGYGPALGEVGTLVPDLLSAFPTAPGRRPRSPRPAATAERARPGRPQRRLLGPTQVHLPANIRQRQATPERPRAPKQSRSNYQRPRSWPLRLGAASSLRRARSQGAAKPDDPHTIFPLETSTVQCKRHIS